MPADTPAKRYESWELRPKWFLLGLLTFAIIMFALGFALMRFWLLLEDHSKDHSAPRSIVQDQMPPSDAPPLQPQTGHEMVDAQDLAAMRHREGQIFDKLGWQWNETRQQRDIPAAVVEAVKHRPAATQPIGSTSAARGAP